MTMMAEDASRRQFVEGAAVAGAAVTVLPQGASAKAVKGDTEAKGFVDPRTYGKSLFKTPYVWSPPFKPPDMCRFSRRCVPQHQLKSDELSLVFRTMRSGT
jgi:hypothetical protein